MKTPNFYTKYDIGELTNSLYELLRASTHEVQGELDVISDPVKEKAVRLLEKHDKIEITFRQGNRIIFKKKGE